MPRHPEHPTPEAPWCSSLPLPAQPRASGEMRTGELPPARHRPSPAGQPRAPPSLLLLLDSPSHLFSRLPARKPTTAMARAEDLAAPPLEPRRRTGFRPDLRRPVFPAPFPASHRRRHALPERRHGLGPVRTRTTPEPQRCALVGPKRGRPRPRAPSTAAQRDCSPGRAPAALLPP